jgi:uncharacterized lipoprotein YmbA
MKTNRPLPAGSAFRWIFLGLAGALAGCSVVPPPLEDPTRYFVLSGVPASATPAEGGLRIGVRTVRLAGYLNRREMVVRAAANEVEFRDYQRWAEPLDAAIARVLRSALQASGRVAQAWAEPFPVDQERDYDVAIEVTRCEGVKAGSGRFEATLSAVAEVWTAGPNPRSVARRVFTAPADSWDGRDFDRLAALLSSDAAALGREVLAAVPPKT